VNFACAGAALLAPPRADAEVDVLGSYKLVEILTDAKDLGERPGFSVRLVGALSERARVRADPGLARAFVLGRRQRAIHVCQHVRFGAGRGGEAEF
jgi:hypothetical protein